MATTLNRVVIYMPDKQLEKLDKYAKKLHLSRSRFILNLLSVAMDDAAILNALGVLDAIGFLRGVRGSAMRGETKLSESA